MLEQPDHQMIVDGPPSADPGTPAKLMQHPRVRGALAMGQMSEATPGSLLGQQAHDPVEAVRRRQRGEQMHPPQLRRAETATTPHAPAPGQQLVDLSIGHVSRKPFQQLRCSNRRQVFKHDPSTTPSDPTCRFQSKKQHPTDATPSTHDTSAPFRNTLRRNISIGAHWFLAQHRR